jgi:membrane-bound lytic murein transglycosylase F
LVLACYSEWCSAKKLFEDKYDSQIRSAAQLYLPSWDWHWWKAQLYQESLLRPDAVSYVGASGICQAMPATFAQWNAHFDWGATASPLNASYCIIGGAWYMANLRAVWTAKRTEDDRRRLAQASYNAGSGNIVRAQSKCGGAVTWKEISPCLVLVTGKYSKETLTYVARIEVWFMDMQ